MAESLGIRGTCESPYFKDCFGKYHNLIKTKSEEVEEPRYSQLLWHSFLLSS